MTAVRVATFNLENFDETGAGARPSLDERIALMRPQIVRLRADIVCFQEVHGQERPGQPRALLALPRLLEGTNLEGANLVSSHDSNGEIANERNLVVATHHAIVDQEQLLNDLVAEPLYRRLTAVPPDTNAVPIGIERPILHVTVDTGAAVVHIINVHLKSKIPTDIPGQKVPGDDFAWESADGWAEGAFVSSMKRMSQALEVRRLVDQILDTDPNAGIVVAGDFNATPDEVPGAGHPWRGGGHRQLRRSGGCMPARSGAGAVEAAARSVRRASRGRVRRCRRGRGSCRCTVACGPAVRRSATARIATAAPVIVPRHVACTSTPIRSRASTTVSAVSRSADTPVRCSVTGWSPEASSSASSATVRFAASRSSSPASASSRRSTRRSASQSGLGIDIQRPTRHVRHCWAAAGRRWLPRGAPRQRLGRVWRPHVHGFSRGGWFGRTCQSTQRSTAAA